MNAFADYYANIGFLFDKIQLLLNVIPSLYLS